MVKRDSSFLMLFWLGRSIGIFLLLCEPVLISLLLWFWPTSTPLEKFTLLFFIVWGFPLAFARLRPPRQHLRLEALRMRSDEAPLLEKQPAYDVADLPVPVTLEVKLAPGACIVFGTFWLAMLGLVLVFQVTYFLAWQILWWVVGVWIALGTLILALSALVFYQRIEVTDEALMVQHGLRRQSIAWPDARLFALISLDEKNTTRANQYELSSERSILRWTHGAVGAGFVLQPRDRNEYRRILEELRAYIRIKTGLMVRDLR